MFRGISILLIVTKEHVSRHYFEVNRLKIGYSLSDSSALHACMQDHTYTLINKDRKKRTDFYWTCSEKKKEHGCIIIFLLRETVTLISKEIIAV